MTPQEAQDKAKIIKAVNDAYPGAQTAGVLNVIKGIIIKFLSRVGRDTWPIIRDIIIDLLRPSAKDDEPVKEPTTPDYAPPTLESDK